MSFNNRTFVLKITIIFSLFFNSFSVADNHNIYEILELIQKDIKTLEKAVYSNSFESNNNGNNSENLNNSNSEDVLTRHLLKLSEIESQFQVLTNKFEEVNFKLDKLSNRLSKVQSDNQIRFQEIEDALSSGEELKVTKKLEKKRNKIITRKFTTTRLGFYIIQRYSYK